MNLKNIKNIELYSKEWKEIIVNGAQKFDITLSFEMIYQFSNHCTELFKWNKKMNLTAIKCPKDVAIKHVIDSIIPLKFISDNSLVLDIGAGGGFPGIPLKIAKPDIKLTLIDASRKKVSFLKHVIRHLKLDHAEALHLRVESLMEDELYINYFDVIINRAFLKLKQFILMALPLLKKDGHLISMKGPEVEKEINNLKKERYRINDEVMEFNDFYFDFKKYTLPFSDDFRSVLLIKRK